MQNIVKITSLNAKGCLLRPFMLSTLSALLAGCASVTTGQQQSVSVDTSPDAGATCELANDGGKWFVNSTPGSVTITRSYSDLTVICKKDNKSGNAKVPSKTKAMAFGNIIAGGLIGAAVDCGTGSAYDYPTVINVPLK
jgi:hypothetical protein